MNERTRTALENIVAEAQHLREHGFTEHAVSRGRGFKLSRVSDEEWELEFDLPNSLIRDATVRVLRLFLLFGQDFSFHRLDRLAQDPQLSQGFSQALKQIRRSYFDFRNTDPTGIETGFFEEGSETTRGEILDTVFNGCLFHTNDSPQRRRYLLWTRDEVRAGVLHQEFTQIMVIVLALIDRLYELSTAELAAHAEGDGSG